MDSKFIGLCPQGFESPRCRRFLPSPALACLQTSRLGPIHARRKRGACVWPTGRRDCWGLQQPCPADMAPSASNLALTAKKNLMREGMASRPPLPNYLAASLFYHCASCLFSLLINLLLYYFTNFLLLYSTSSLRRYFPTLSEILSL